MLPECRWAHVRSLRQFVPGKHLNKVLLEPSYRLRNLLARRPGGDQVPQMPAVRTGQQADDDFLLDQRSQPRNQGGLIQQPDEPNERIEQGRVEWLERDGPRDIVAARPGLVQL